MKVITPYLKSRAIVQVAILVLVFGAPGNAAFGAQNSHNALVARGYAQLAKGETIEAIKTLTQVLHTNPKDTQARRYLAAALIRANQGQEGLQQIQYVIKLEPGQQSDQVTLGEAYYACGKYDEAILCLQKVVSQNPYLDAARIDLINAYMASRRMANANQTCLEGIQAARSIEARNHYYRLMQVIRNREENDTLPAPEEKHDTPGNNNENDREASKA